MYNNIKKSNAATRKQQHPSVSQALYERLIRVIESCSSYIISVLTITPLSLEHKAYRQVPRPRLGRGYSKRAADMLRGQTVVPQATGVCRAAGARGRPRTPENYSSQQRLGGWRLPGVPRDMVPGRRPSRAQGEAVLGGPVT